MGKLVKRFQDAVIVATERVAAPGYILYVGDQEVPGHIQDGWNYFEEEVSSEDFAPSWVQPSGSENAYDLGAVVFHNNITWRSLIVANVWEPGVSGWSDITSDTPAWIQPTGAHDSYVTDAVVSHGGTIWKSLVEGNVWEPGVSAWREAYLTLEDGTEVPPDWIQPTGAHDSYQTGDRVTHSAQIWVSTVDNNVWEPGVFGWVLE